MSRPGGFTGVLAAGSWEFCEWHNYISPDVCLPLPAAVPVHAGHRPLSTPVGVAVPWLVPEWSGDRAAIVVDAVFSSRAHKAFSRAQAGQLALSAIYTNLRWTERDGKHYATNGVIVAADLVGDPRDRRAQIRSVTSFEHLTDAQAEVQRRLDAFSPMTLSLAALTSCTPRGDWGGRRSSRCGTWSCPSVLSA